MRIGARDEDKSKGIYLNLSDLSDRIYVDGKMWISTSYGVIKIGIVGGAAYELQNRELVQIGKQVGVTGCNQSQSEDS